MKLTLDMKTILQCKEKNVLGVFDGSLEIYTRVADEKQKKSWVFFSNLVEGDHYFFNYFKGAVCKKFGKPCDRGTYD